MLKKIATKITKAVLDFKDNCLEAKEAYKQHDDEKLSQLGDKFLEDAAVGAGVILAKKTGLAIMAGEDIADTIADVNPVVGGIVLANLGMGVIAKATPYVKKAMVAQEMLNKFEHGQLTAEEYADVLAVLKKGSGKNV